MLQQGAVKGCIRIAILCVFLGLITHCRGKQSSTGACKADKSLNFNIRDFGTFKIVVVRAAMKTATYVLARDLSDIPDSLAPYRKIQIPLRSFVAMSTSQLAYIEALGERRHLKGFPNTELIYDPRLRARAARGDLLDIGNAQLPDVETLLKLNPAVVFCFSQPGLSRWKGVVEQAGIPVIPVDDYAETTPLARSSWIYFFAAFFDKTPRATAIFHAVKRRYEAIAKKALELEKKPLVLSGIMYGDVWYAAGPCSVSGRLIADAGGINPWAGNHVDKVVRKSFEAVYQRAGFADFWVNVSDFESRAQLRAFNANYGLFKAYQTQALYAPVKAKKGRSNDYFESAALRCDRVLGDLYHIFSRSPAQLVYYKKLK